MEQRVLRFKHDDRTLVVTPRDISAGRLRQFKAWFGKEYGAYLPFLQLVGQLDGDAVACAMWVARTKAGLATPEARVIDWTPDDLLALYDDEEILAEDLEPGPTQPEAETPDTAIPASTTTA